jgi:hypothetical protein
MNGYALGSASRVLYYNAIGELIHHGIAGDLTEAAALALKAAWTLT